MSQAGYRYYGNRWLSLQPDSYRGKKFQHFIPPLPDWTTWMCKTTVRVS